MEVKSINLLIKPTLQCNARCIYCHSLKPSVVLSDELLTALFRKLSDFVKRRNIADVSIKWHGGEPMLAGHGFYSKVLELQGKYFHSIGVEIAHSINTNSTLYRGDMRLAMMGLLRSREATVSFDPFHGTRPFAGGVNYASEAIKSVRLLFEDGFNVGIVYVIHKKSVEVVRELYYFFKNLGVSGMLFNPVEELTDPDYMLSPEEYCEFLIRLNEVWQDDNFSFGICPLEEWRNWVVHGQAVSRCEYGPAMLGFVHVVISPEGFLYPCHRYQDRNEHCIGNILDMSFDDIVEKPVTNILADKKHNLTDECRACDYVDLCRSGCVATHDASGKTFWCKGLREAFPHLVKRWRLTA